MPAAHHTSATLAAVGAIAPNASSPREGVRVLLAEDNCIAAELLRLIGHRLGAEIDWVENGLDAVDCIHRAREAGTPYKLLLIDAMMPVLSGVDATRRLRTSGIGAAELPIVAVTAATAPEEVRSFFEAGMQAWLAKPVSIADLAACIDAWVPEGPGEIGSQPHDRSLAALRKRYALRRAEVFALLESAIAAGNCPAELGAELRNHLHKLAGTAGSFGEDGLSKAAAYGATLLAEARPATLESTLRQALARLKEAA